MDLVRLKLPRVFRKRPNLCPESGQLLAKLRSVWSTPSLPEAAQDLVELALTLGQRNSDLRRHRIGTNINPERILTRARSAVVARRSTALTTRDLGAIAPWRSSGRRRRVPRGWAETGRIHAGAL